jgi:hypothetical protein
VDGRPVRVASQREHRVENELFQLTKVFRQCLFTANGSSN